MIELELLSGKFVLVKSENLGLTDRGFHKLRVVLSGDSTMIQRARYTGRKEFRDNNIN